jgi:GNAT superfamily N-acetyltransferase
MPEVRLSHDPPTIRPARADDAPALARAWLDAGRFYERVDPETYRVPDEAGLVDWLKQGLDEATTLVAEHDGRLLGFVAARLLEPDPDARFQIQRELAGRRLAIDAVAVIEAHRRAGVGSALVHAAEAWGREHGASVVMVDANWDSGVAEGFYERALGYTRRGLNLRK